MKSIACHQCKHVWTFEPPLGRRDCCPKCGMDARVCRNCRFFDTSSYRQCREEQAEWVQEKDKGNFCGFFTARDTQSADAAKDTAKSKLDALFGGSGESPKPQAADLAGELDAFLKKRQK